MAKGKKVDGRRPPVLLLWGSETGNAEAIAADVASTGDELGFDVRLVCMKDALSESILHKSSCVIFIVSTTGDGDPPENAVKFMRRRVKQRSIPSNALYGVSYAILGLGDTNYSHFCNTAKVLNKRLPEIGAKAFMPTAYADDATGLEDIVEPWKEQIWNAVASYFECDGCVSAAVVPRESAELLDGFVPMVDASVITGDNVADVNATDIVADSIKGLSVTGDKETTATATKKKGGATSITAYQPFLSVEWIDDTSRVISPRTDLGNALTLKIVNARYLTTENAVKRTLLVELESVDKDGTDIYFHAGDSFAVLPENPLVEVMALAARLNLSLSRRFSTSILTGTTKKRAAVPSHLIGTLSVEELLSHRLELRGVPKKATLRMLAASSGISMEDRKRLEFLCSRDGTASFEAFRVTVPSLLDILEQFPSVSPSLSGLLECLPVLTPRCYSAANAPGNGKLRFAFNVVEWTVKKGDDDILRQGICSSWLERISLNFLQNKEVTSNPRIVILPRPPNAFRVPSHIDVPIVMVGPGTGVAPFIGFLQERRRQRSIVSSNPDVVPSPAWLFFGNRHRKRDFLFEDELNEFLADGTLDRLEACFSRDVASDDDQLESNTGYPGDDEESIRYVQHAIDRNSEALVSVLLQPSCRIYVCGDARNMAKDVHSTFVAVLARHATSDVLSAFCDSKDPAVCAEAMLSAWKEEEPSRYVRDVW